MRSRPRARERRDARVQAHARDDRRPRARGDPAARDRRLDDAVRDDGGDADLARLLPRPRSGPSLRVPQEGAAVLPVVAWRGAMGAEVSATPGADPRVAR